MPITQVREDEYEAWKAVWSAFIAHMSATLPESQYQNTWSRIRNKAGSSVEQHGDIGCLVAREDDGTIVGLASWLDMGRSWKPSKEVYLEDLFVFESARGKGYGKQLILAVAAEGARQGSDAMHWTTGLQNVWAERMYDQIAHFGHKWYSMNLPYKPKSSA